MKLSTAIILGSMSSASAFSDASVTRISATSLSSSTALEMAASSGTRMSKALPMLESPPALDGTLPGDAGFDPLNFSPTKEDLMLKREAEVKHARLAMLAAAGWPVSELFDRDLAEKMGLDPALANNDRAPSVLNGGLENISPLYWGLALIFASAIEIYGTMKMRDNEPGYYPGNLGFDPLGLYPKEEVAQRRMQLAEIKNGRLAMLAITGFAFQEFFTEYGVVEQTPFFFKSMI